MSTPPRRFTLPVTLHSRRPVRAPIRPIPIIRPPIRRQPLPLSSTSAISANTTTTTTTNSLSSKLAASNVTKYLQKQYGKRNYPGGLIYEMYSPSSMSPTRSNTFKNLPIGERFSTERQIPAEQDYIDDEYFKVVQCRLMKNPTDIGAKRLRIEFGDDVNDMILKVVNAVTGEEINPDVEDDGLKKSVTFKGGFWKFNRETFYKYEQTMDVVVSKSVRKLRLDSGQIMECISDMDVVFISSLPIFSCLHLKDGGTSGYFLADEVNMMEKPYVVWLSKPDAGPGQSFPALTLNLLMSNSSMELLLSNKDLLWLT